MKGYATAIEKETLKNSDFRRVLYTGKCSQLVLMNLKLMEEIGMETAAALIILRVFQNEFTSLFHTFVLSICAQFR